MLVLILLLLCNLVDMKVATTNNVHDNEPTSKDALNLASSWSKNFCGWNVVLPGMIEDAVADSNKIFGMATGTEYTVEKLVPFCKSVRLSGYRGSVLLGISKLKGSAERKRNKMFKKYNIASIYLDRVKGNEWSQSICRYHAYMQVVDHFANENDSILITDVRDVIFQDDPFNSNPYGSMHFLNSSVNLLLFLEGLNDISKDRVTLANTAPNVRWITNIYSYKIFKSLGHNPPICSGTTIGKKSGMQYYLRSMLYQGYLCLKRNPKKYIKNRGHVCSGGADQGFHNFLFWDKHL